MTAKSIVETPLSLIAFDCDSTLAALEGVDEIASRLADEVARITALGMKGEITFLESLERRLDLLRPSRQKIEGLAHRYVEAMTPHAKEVVAAFLYLGKRVVMISGGIRESLFRLGDALGLSEDDVFGVQVSFSEDGAYESFDKDQPLVQERGKARVIREITGGVAEGAALIGDGFNDLEAAPDVEVFVGFGGIEPREEIRVRAPHYVTARSLAPVLSLLVTKEERKQLAGTEHAKVLREGDRLLG
ncbi:MAG: HAD-IB family phosphatase [Planctomycetota bacterium]